MMEGAKHLKTILDSSMAEYQCVLAEEDLACEWSDNGLLYVLQSDRGLSDFAQIDQILSEHFGVQARQISGAELPSFDPALRPGLAGAFFYRDDASLRPDLLALEWSRRLRDRGVQFVENCELLSIRTSNRRVTHVVTSDGEKQVDRIVVATGAWSPQLARELGCLIPIEPGKGYSVTMARPDPCPTYPMLFPEHKVGMTPFGDRYRLGSMMEFVGYDSTVPPQRIAQLRESATPYLVAPFTDEVIDTWYGWRPMTWDSLPIIGAVPNLCNAYLATGHNMLGLSLSTATGRLIAELIREVPPHIDPAPFSPRRFN
jgi:D-amino-acid dehydrogenase